MTLLMPSNSEKERHYLRSPWSANMRILLKCARLVIPFFSDSLEYKLEM